MMIEILLDFGHRYLCNSVIIYWVMQDAYDQQYQCTLF